MAGRPSKLTPEVVKDLDDAIRLGATYADAAEYAGIGESTFHRWMEQGGKAQTGEYRDFWEHITRTKARGKVALLAKIEKAANDGDWRAASWKLERRDPEGYGQQVRMRHGGDADAPPIQTETKLTAKVVTYDEFSDRFASLFLGDGTGDVGDDDGTAGDEQVVHPA